MFRKGERIEVTGLMEDPDPVPVGTKGTVTGASGIGTPYEQVWVNWDVSPDGRKRSLILIPEDYRIVRRVRQEAVGGGGAATPGDESGV